MGTSPPALRIWRFRFPRGCKGTPQVGQTGRLSGGRSLQVVWSLWAIVSVNMERRRTMRRSSFEFHTGVLFVVVVVLQRAQPIALKQTTQRIMTTEFSTPEIHGSLAQRDAA